MLVANLIRATLTQRLMVLLVALGMSAAGVWAFRQLPIDAYPDISSPQVQVIVKAPGLAPLEVESRITRIIENEMQGVPEKTILRSLTKYGLSVVTIDFKETTDIYWARQQVAERLNQIWGALPKNISGGLAPITTPLGEAYMFYVEGAGYTNRELRSILDYDIRPRLLTVDGVAEVNALGGEVKTFDVMPNPQALIARGLTINDLKVALESNNRNDGGDRIERNNEVLLIRTIGQLTGIDSIKATTVATRDGVPILIGDLAEVAVGSMTRYGGVTKSGEGEFVEGIVLQRKGANGSRVVIGIKEKFAEIIPTLPAGVHIEVFYDRSVLVGSAIATVQTALTEAIVLVIVVLLFFLGNLRSAAVVVAVLPLSVLFTFLAMLWTGTTANLMSLGGLAIAIGILVDSAVVVVENIQTHLSHGLKARDRLHIIYRAVLEVAQPVISGTLIIIIVFMPIFSLIGLEGKLFKPLAITISLALIGSLVLSLTVIPVLASLLMKSVAEVDPWLVRILKRAYRPIVAFALRARALVLSVAVALLVIAGFLYTRIGAEFMPTLDEGTIVVIVEKLPSIGLKRSLEIDGKIQQAMMTIPEITGVASRMGSDELRLDPMGLYQTDNFLITKPRSQWSVKTPEALQEKIREVLEKFPGIEFAFTQPIDMRVSEMLTGVRAAVAVKLSGSDLAVLEEKSKAIEELMSTIPGNADVMRIPLSGQIYLNVTMNHQAMGRYGVTADQINDLVSLAVGGQVVTEVAEGVRRTGVVLRYPEVVRNSPEKIGDLLISTPAGQKIPLRQLATIAEVDGPVQITREASVRQVVIQSNVDGRDIVSYVDDLRAAIAKQIVLPTGYLLSYGGQFENQQRASAQLAVVVPVAIVLIFVLLFITFGNLRQAGLVILNIPFALIGGIVALYVSGLYLSVPASVGFIALFGTAILNGVVMISYFNHLRRAGVPLLEAAQQGAERRLRPVLMTAACAGLGLIPLLLATGPGSEIQRPLAVVVLGGLITSTALTLILLPTLYVWIESRHTRLEVL